MPLIIIVILVLIAAIVAAIMLIPNALANSHAFFVRPLENEIVVITKEGSLDRMIPNIPGYNLDANYNVVESPHSPGNPGLHFIGLYPFYQVYGYDFSWSKYSQPKEGTVGKVIPMGEKVYSMYWRFTYAIIVSVRTEDDVPAKVLYLVEMETVNPRIALFVARKWLDLATGFIESAVNSVVGTVQFEDITGAKWDPHEKSIMRKLFALNTKIDLGGGATSTLPLETGVKIRNATYIRFITEDSQEQQRLNLKRAEGKADAAALKALIEAAPNAPIEQVLNLAATKELATAMKETKASTIVVGGADTKVSVPVGGSKK